MAKQEDMSPEQSQVYTSSDEEASSSSSREETAAAMELGKLGAKVLELEQKLDGFERRYLATLSRSVMSNWAKRAGLKRELAFDDHLDAQRLRTTTGNLVTSLNTVLLDLDSIESHGNTTIRRARRGLVLKLTNSCLPRSELDFAKADKLVQFDLKLRKMLQQAAAAAKAGNEQDAMEQDNEDAIEHNDEITETAETREDEDMSETDTHTTPQDAINEAEQSPRKRQTHRTKRQISQSPPLDRLAPLEHRMRETEDMVMIYVGAPDRDLTLNDTRVQVDRSSGELEVLVRGHDAQKFDVTHQLLAPLETSYSVNNGVLVIKVPKRRPARAMYQPPRAYHGYQHRQPFYHQRAQPVHWFY